RRGRHARDGRVRLQDLQRECGAAGAARRRWRGPGDREACPCRRRRPAAGVRPPHLSLRSPPPLVCPEPHREGNGLLRPIPLLPFTSMVPHDTTTGATRNPLTELAGVFDSVEPTSLLAVLGLIAALAASESGTGDELHATPCATEDHAAEALH